MKTSPNVLLRLGLVCCGLMLAPRPATAGILDFLISRNDLQAITVTDTTPQARLLRIPSPEHPVYYAAISGGYHDLGGIKAGEKPVARQLVNQTMLKALAKQGYLPATEQHAAEIVLIWSWGTYNVQTISGGGMSPQVNYQHMLRFLGGDKLGLTSFQGSAFQDELLLPGLLYNGGDRQDMIDTARDDLYVAIVNAYMPDPRKPERPVKLWSTRISCPSRGFWLPEALPAMIAIATPYIGRDTSKPVWIRATDKFKPEIKLGDMKLVEYIESGQAPVVEMGPSR